MLRKVLFSIFLLTVLAAMSQAQFTIYVRIKGARQGFFKGGVTGKAHEGYSHCSLVDDQIDVPRDPATGLATGRPVHKPLLLDLALDAAAPQLYNALLDDEVLTDGSIEFWSTTTTGVARLAYQIKLTNAVLTSVRTVQPGSTASAGELLPAVKIGLMYQKAERIHSGGTSNIDVIGGGG